MEVDSVRYERQLLLDGFGPEGQRKLAEARVLVIGAGGLGSPALLYLCAAGVGTIGIVDDDLVELSNLQRQIIHSTKTLGEKKTESAEKILKDLNPDTRIITYPYRLDRENAGNIISDYDFVVDCTDGNDSKYLINEVCVKSRKPFCHAGVRGYSGHLMTVVPGITPCLNCIFPRSASDHEKNQARKGVMGPVVGVIGTLEAVETVNYIAYGAENAGTLIRYSGDKQNFRKISFNGPVKECKVCGSLFHSGNIE